MLPIKLTSSSSKIHQNDLLKNRSQSSPNCLNVYDELDNELDDKLDDKNKCKKINQFLNEMNNQTINNHPYDLRKKLNCKSSSSKDDHQSNFVNMNPINRPTRSSNSSPNLNQTHRKKIKKLCNSCSTNHIDFKFNNSNNLFMNLKCGDDFISKLPVEILFKIFSYLKENDLCSLSLVSKKFYNISNDCELWKRLYQLLYDYDLPLFREENCEFVFKNPEESDHLNPWRESFKQLYKSIHIRQESELNLIVSGIFKIAAVANTKINNQSSLTKQYNKYSSDNNNNNSSIATPLIFLHKGLYRPKSSLVIDYDLILIGAASGPVDSIAKQVIIQNDKESTVHFTNSVKNSYLGYVTLNFKPEDTIANQHYALKIDKMSKAKITNCILKSTCEVGATIYVHGENTEPTIKNCTVADCMCVGFFIDSYARGLYVNNYIARNSLAGIWVKNADPIFKYNVCSDGRDVGIFCFDNAQGYFDSNDIYGNRIANFECKGANPTVVKCTIHHGKTGKKMRLVNNFY